MKRNGNARIEAPKAPRGMGSGEGVTPSPVGEGPGEFSDFLSSNGAFWCILGACFHLV